MDEPTIRYTNGEITVLWKPKRCIHSGTCVRGLPRVFNVAARPWVNMLGATTEEIRAQVERCPSGALTWEEPTEKEPALSK
jgi:putative redox protein